MYVYIIYLYKEMGGAHVYVLGNNIQYYGIMVQTGK